MVTDPLTASWEEGAGREEELLPLLRAHGRSPTSFLCLHPQTSIYRSSRGCLAYRSTRFADVVLGEPITDPSRAGALLRDFARDARSRDQSVVAFPVTSEGLRAYRVAGFQPMECGSEAVTDLGRFRPDGPRRANVRRSARHASRAGVFVETIPPGSTDVIRLARDFHDITEDWLRSRKTGPLSFIVGEPVLPGFRECRYFLARTSGRVEAFAIFYPVYPERAVYMDITRRRRDSPNGTMDLLLSEAFRTLASESVRRAYLGMVPCVLSPEAPRTLESAIMRIAFRRLNGMYPMRTEFFFKDKFATSWERRFVCFHPRKSLRSMLAVYAALWPHGIPSILRHKLRAREDGQAKPPVPSSSADRSPARLWGSKRDRAASKAWPATTAPAPRSTEDTK